MPLKGYKKTEECKRKISETMKGRVFSEEHKKNVSIACKGLKSTLEHRKKLSETHSGDKNWNWRGGISKNPYPKEFNSILKLKIRERDNLICCLCGKTEREELEDVNHVLCVNHIDFDKNNCKENNLNTLCMRCNIKINHKREYWTYYFQNNQDK